MKVWRIQHQCSAPHGPMQGCPDGSNWDSVPNYGSCLETPSSPDSGLAHLNLNVMKEYIFGTLPEQFPLWWSLGVMDWDTFERAPVDKTLKDGWYAFCFEVEDGAAIVGTNQVIFDSYRCVELFRTQTDFPR